MGKNKDRLRFDISKDLKDLIDIEAKNNSVDNNLFMVSVLIFYCDKVTTTEDDLIFTDVLRYPEMSKETKQIGLYLSSNNKLKIKECALINNVTIKTFAISAFKNWKNSIETDK
jgi:uncharacterized protein (DUF1778 family)